MNARAWKRYWTPQVKMSALDRQRAFREQHKPAQPPYLGVMLAKSDCQRLARGIVTKSVRQMAHDALQAFWPTHGSSRLGNRKM